ncbi:MAG: hypothetical protein JO125_16370 [Chloroflexi bacterium]|nr:hypothetical protein [Ktedonobacteraceae bacterium]MBV9708971.1 hypothetical protein [Chloroflexota bacterium]
MSHDIHQDHIHTHSEHCGHTAIEHDGHVDYVHNGHLHSPHGEHYDEHVIAVSEQNPAACAPVNCACGHTDCGHETIPHGDHVDYLYEGQLHHPHGDHCDNHGPLKVM